MRPQKLDTHVVTDLLIEPTKTTFSLRAEVGSESGFDIVTSEGRVQIARTGPTDDPSVGSFELVAEETPALVDLAQKLRAFATFKSGKLSRATIGDVEFHSLPLFAQFVEQLVSMLAPIVREIIKHCITPNELVIRRLLGDDRREEIFVSRASLIEKYAHLQDPHRGIFAPLGLEEGAPPLVIKPAEAKPEPAKPEASKPPPAKADPPKKASVRPPPPAPKTSAKPPPPPIRTVALSDSDITEEPKDEKPVS
jgi:hypothetical protein